jgi:hypothetical protein
MKNAVFFDVAPCGCCYDGRLPVSSNIRVEKIREMLQDPHGATSQKTAIFNYLGSLQPRKQFST